MSEFATRKQAERLFADVRELQQTVRQLSLQFETKKESPKVYSVIVITPIRWNPSWADDTMAQRRQRISLFGKHIQVMDIGNGNYVYYDVEKDVRVKFLDSELAFTEKYILNGSFEKFKEEEKVVGEYARALLNANSLPWLAGA